MSGWLNNELPGSACLYLPLAGLQMCVMSGAAPYLSLGLQMCAAVPGLFYVGAESSPRPFNFLFNQELQAGSLLLSSLGPCGIDTL